MSLLSKIINYSDTIKKHRTNDNNKLSFKQVMLSLCNFYYENYNRGIIEKKKL